MKKRFVGIVLLLISIGVLSYFLNESIDEVYPPYFPQEEKYYCGEACIQMMIAYYNVTPLPSQDELAIEAGFSHNETHPNNMSRPFTNRNFDVCTTENRNFTEAYNQLINTLNVKPVIILVTIQDSTGDYFGHYLFIFEYTKNGVQYHDPQTQANQCMTVDELEIQWFHNCNISGRKTCWLLCLEET